MYKVINGRRYNTETAKKVGEKDYYDDGNWFYSQSLYRKATGEFFLHYCGNVRNIFWDGDKIEPVTIPEAKAWAEEHLDGDEYEWIFGLVDDDTTEASQKTQISILLTAEEKLRAEALGLIHGDVYRTGLKVLEQRKRG
jgi:hypothetical protein